MESVWLEEKECAHEVTDSHKIPWSQRPHKRESNRGTTKFLQVGQNIK